MKLDVTSLRSRVIAIGQPVGSLGPFATKTFEVTVSDVERLAPQLLSLQRSGAITFDAYNDPQAPADELDTQFTTALDMPAPAPTNMALLNAVRTFHEPCITPSRSVSSPGQGPQPAVNNALMTLVFTLNQTSNRAYRVFKIPDTFVDSPSFHVHWTKSSDANENGHNVRWRVGYTIIDGQTMDASGTPTMLLLDDTYADAGTTTRTIYRTSDVAITGFQPGWYVSCFIEAITPTGTALTSSPALLSLDMKYRATINLGQ